MLDRNLLSFTKLKLKDLMDETGQAKFRAKQLFLWLHQKQCFSWDDMMELPKTLRAELAEKHSIFIPQVQQKQSSADGTVKYLMSLEDGNLIESVLMRYNYGNTLCVSTQVGCRMGCRFCASTQGGLVRNLSAGEIVGQIYSAEAETGEKISNIVLMGIGEPLDNMEAVLDFISIITDEDGHNTSIRNITLSTCGIVPKILELAEHKLGITLSISLHATDNKTRSDMMPVNDAYSIEELVRTCMYYQKKSGRRVSFEYAMVKGVNDSEQDAQNLASMLKKMGAHVNLIPINPVDGAPFTATYKENVVKFQKTLLTLGVNATIRRRLGADIDAACGQLRSQAERRL